MSSHQVSRRTLARGAAWTVPMVAVAVAAPAYAASQVFTPIVDAGASCKCPGSGANNFNFKAVLAFSTSGSDDWKIHVTSWTFDGEEVPALPADTTLTGGDGNVIVMVDKTNSAAKHTVSVVYTAQNLTTLETVSGSFGPIELTFAPDCAFPITCP